MPEESLGLATDLSVDTLVLLDLLEYLVDTVLVVLSHFRVLLPNQVLRLYTQLLSRLRVYLQFLDQDLGQFLADLLPQVGIRDV